MEQTQCSGVIRVGCSYTLSPVLHEGKLYVVTDSGQVSSFNTTTGEPYYHQVRLPRPYNFKASPVGANGKLYLASEEGDVIVLKLGEKFEVVATNTLDGPDVHRFTSDCRRSILSTQSESALLHQRVFRFRISILGLRRKLELNLQCDESDGAVRFLPPAGRQLLVQVARQQPYKWSCVPGPSEMPCERLG